MQPLRHPPPQARAEPPRLIEGPKDKAPGGQARGFEGHTTEGKFDCRPHPAEDQDQNRSPLTLGARKHDKIAASLARRGFGLCLSGGIWRIEPIGCLASMRASGSQ